MGIIEDMNDELVCIRHGIIEADNELSHGNITARAKHDQELSFSHSSTNLYQNMNSLPYHSIKQPLIAFTILMPNLLDLGVERKIYFE
jgi:hypothetical protein